MHKPLHYKRYAAIAAVIGIVTALLGSSLIATGSADLSTKISANKNAAAQLRSDIASETKAISQSAGAVAVAEQKLSIEQSDLDTHIDELKKVQLQLMDARIHLERLEHRLHLASDDLAANLRSAYETGTPNLVDVILSANGFQNLLQKVSFMKRTAHQDTAIVSFTRQARTEVLHYTIHLGKLEARDRTLTDQILAQRNHVAAIKAALVAQQISQEQKRDGTQSKLSNVNSTISHLQSRLHAIEAAAAKKAAQTPVEVNQQVGGIAIDTGSMVQAPADAPAAVKEMIDAGNAIATLPYIWGGGHGSFISPGYDCSGSVSYVLAAAGLLSAPETSDEFMSYGDPGPGKWVTIWATDGHVWMTIAGWRFDTVALAEDGTRWSQGGGEFAGFVERHPPGL